MGSLCLVQRGAASSARDLETSLDNTGRPCLYKKILKISWTWWYVPVVPATQEAEMEDHLNLEGGGCSELSPCQLHYSLSNRVRPCLKKRGGGNGVQWLKPVIPTLQEAMMGGSPEPRSSGPGGEPLYLANYSFNMDSVFKVCILEPYHRRPGEDTRLRMQTTFGEDRRLRAVRRPRGPGRWLAGPLLGLAAGRRRRGGLGLAVAVAFRSALGGGAGRALGPLGLALQQLLQVTDVADGGAERLHFAEALVRQLPGQVVSEARVALVHAAHPLPLALVASAEEGGLEGAVQRRGQVLPSPRAAAARPLPAHGSQMQGDPERVPARQPGQGLRHAQGRGAQRVGQGQQSRRFTCLHHSPESTQITQECQSDNRRRRNRIFEAEVLVHPDCLAQRIRAEVPGKEVGPPNPHLPCVPADLISKDNKGGSSAWAPSRERHGSHSCHPGWNALARSWLTAPSASQAQTTHPSISASLMEFRSVTRLECNGAILAHCNLHLLSSKSCSVVKAGVQLHDPGLLKPQPPGLNQSASRVAGTTAMCHHI
ncbi:hypothetical protein AAY473_020641 [Plecturocebus cupreus]